MDKVFLILAPLAISVLVLLALLYLSLKRNQTNLNHIQTFIISFVLLMTISFFLELLSIEENVMRVWNVTYYIGLAGSCFFILFYCLKFLDLKKWMSPLRLGLWAAIPILAIVLVATDPVLGLYYDSVSISSFGSLTYLNAIPGFGFSIYVVYYTALLLFLIYSLIREYFSAVSSNHDAVVVLIISLSVLLANFLLIITLNISIPSTYTFLLLLNPLMVIFYLLTSRIENRVASPTYKRVLQELDTGVLVMDVNDRVMFSNKMAERALQLRSGDTFPEELGNDLFSDQNEGEPVERTLRVDDKLRYFDIKTKRLCDDDGQQRARLVVLNDVNDRVRFRTDLLKMQDKMNILSSITKHDIMNQLTVIMGYGELIQNSEHAEGTYRKQLSAILKASQSISSQLEFLRDYQNVGKNIPNWYPISELMKKAHEQTNLEGITCQCQTDCYEIFADPMIEKVVPNLINNTILHGGPVNKISLHTNLVNDDLIITYEDDGVGIPVANKEKIFNREFGIGTGLGLFLSRSILTITDIEITENGIEGQGARFVIRIPKNMYRTSCE